MTFEDTAIREDMVGPHGSGSQPSAPAPTASTLWRRVRMALGRHRGHPYAAFREVLREVIPHSYRRWAVQLVRRRFGLSTLRDRWAARRQTTMPLPVIDQKQTTGDFFAGLTLRPHLPGNEVQEILNQPPSSPRLPLPDIICFSIIDWSFRFQRPQQLMAQFAASGHRVFYLNITDFHGPFRRPRFSAQPIPHAFGDGTQPPLGKLYEVKLATHNPLDLYGCVVAGKASDDVLAALDDLRRAFDIHDAVGYVMIPSWGHVAQAVQTRWGWRIVYDCMDEWANFPGIRPDALALEKCLVQACDLLVVTAQRLYEKWQPYHRPMMLARNAADYEFYAARCRPNPLLSGLRQPAGDNLPASGSGSRQTSDIGILANSTTGSFSPASCPKHPLVGYYGAIADWFDVELLAEVARSRADYTFVLLGGVFGVDVSALQALPNVRLLGQQPYETMPQYLHHFDACIIPFKINPITEATDPVKLYEYLSGGKPVVALRLPELTPYRDYVYLADDAAGFAAQLDRALREDSPAKAEQRKALARQHTWRRRYQTIMGELRSVTPRASIVIVTYNNLALTKLCLESVLRNTEYPNYEIVVVDNKSADETPAYLRALAARHGHVSIILNDANAGFAKANNQGIARATGEYLVLLNNDTITPPGWLSRLLRHLRDPNIGLIGPMTNFVGNEAKLDVDYRTWAEMLEFARRHEWARQDEIADIHMLAMFCVALRRDVYERVGPLDEQFGVGMFEDDDYALRVRQAGLRVVCAADAFIHHFGQAAFGKLIANGEYNGIFDKNRRSFESKWNVTWQPKGHAPVHFTPHLHAAES